MTTNTALYNSMMIDVSKMAEINKIKNTIIDNKHRYQSVANVTDVPWHVIAIIHYRESGNNFKRHLHNGDPLSARTIQVPKGRPLKGKPPFSWEQSAEDALRMQGLDKVKDWSIGNTLELLEKYNGLGYRKKGVPSPYLWNFSSVYKGGKYVADGKYDPGAIDKQCGCAVLLRQLIM